MDIYIDESGVCSAIHSDSLHKLLSLLGEVRISRASHVEFIEGNWHVDLSPIGGPEDLTQEGFSCRNDALEGEGAWVQKWLKERLTPACQV